MSTSSPEDHAQRKKRIGKACDTCRIKKTRCDGKMPCSRCMADNKICAFTEKKRNKERVHPSGYIDMLETRVDLLSKSLMKVLTIAEPHLPFMAEIKERQITKGSSCASDSDSVQFSDMSVPINDVINYLISDLGLLSDSPHKMNDTIQYAVNLRPIDTQSQIVSKDDIDKEIDHRHSSCKHELSPTAAPDIDAVLSEARDLKIAANDSPNFPTFEADIQKADSINSRDSISSFEVFAALDSLTSRDSLFTHYGSKNSTSSSSISTLASAYREENENENRQICKRPQSAKRSQSPYAARRVNSGHIQKPYRPFTSPPHYTAGVLSEIDKELQLGQISGFIPSFHDAPPSGKYGIPYNGGDNSHNLRTEFHENLLFNESPSRQISDTVDLNLETDIFGAGNPFTSSF